MQDNINTLNKELVDAKISLDEIYLDPNNPRLHRLNGMIFQISKFQMQVFKQQQKGNWKKNFLFTNWLIIFK